jgi:uncharacterized protein (TIGR00369 family)
MTDLTLLQGGGGDAVASALRHADLDPASTRRREVVYQDPVASFERAVGMTGLEQMRAISSGELPPPPIAVLMNMAPQEVELERVVFTGEPGEEHYNPIGVVHGGYASTLLDTVLGCAVQTTLSSGETYTTQTLEVKLVRPITRETGTVRAEGVISYRGRRQATAEARIESAEGKLLATGTSTCMIL